MLDCPLGEEYQHFEVLENPKSLLYSWNKFKGVSMDIFVRDRCDTWHGIAKIEGLLKEQVQLAGLNRN